MTHDGREGIGFASLGLQHPPRVIPVGLGHSNDAITRAGARDGQEVPVGGREIALVFVSRACKAGLSYDSHLE